MISLTPTSYIVLGLVNQAGEATPYSLKQMAAATIGNFFSIPHSQIYAEPDRLAGAGYLSVRREEGGRRRKHYALTEKGRQALADWRTEPATGVPELRDLGILKLFMGADPTLLGEAQAAAHEEKLQQYYEIRKLDMGLEPRGPWIALDAGIQYEKHMIRYWRRLADSGA